MPLYTIELLNISCIVWENKNHNFILRKQILKQFLAQQMYLLTACKVCFCVFEQLTAINSP